MSKYKPKMQHKPIDPEVELPAAIRAASARSEQLHKQMYEQEAQPEAQPEANPEGQEAAFSPTQEGANGTEGKPTQPQREEAAEPEVEKEKPRAPAPDGQKPVSGEDNWEHKYNSLKGRYDQQATAVSNMTHRINEMEALIARLGDTANNQQAPTPAELTFKPISQEERETFGEDFIDVAQRSAMERLNPEVSRLSNEIKKLQDQLGKVVTTTAKNQQQNIYTFLDSKLENWRAINRDQEFIAWASLPDPFSGVTRIEMLREAFNKGDGPRVLNFFQGFLKDEAATDPAARVKPEVPASRQNKVPLETFAAPGRAKAPAATEHNAPGEKETITRAQIANFYRLKAQGHWRGNPEEEKALEARIFAAEREGRIV